MCMLQIPSITFLYFMLNIKHINIYFIGLQLNNTSKTNILISMQP